VSARLAIVALAVAALSHQGVAPVVVHPRAATVQAPAPVVESGTIRVGVLRSGTYEVETLPMDVYVARVLAGEAAPDSSPAALEALAIVIRTYTLTNRGRHRADGFDLCDQTHCQVMRTATAATERAAAATSDQILLYRGEPATVYYSASCGGRSEKPSNVWPGADDPPYLRIHDDDGCGGFPAWTSELADVDLQRAFSAAGYRGTLRDMRILTRNDSGRVARLELQGLTPKEITGQDLRMVVGRTLGFQHIQSTAFELRRSGRAFRFTGHGAGHGVGLCVIGSMKLAAAGQSASAILARYFPGTQIGAAGPRLTSVAPRGGTTPTTSDPRAAAAPSSPAAAPPVAVPSPPGSSAAAGVPSAGVPAAGGPVPAPAGAAPARPPITPTSATSATGGVTVVVPAADSGDRDTLVQLVSRERAAMAQALGVEPPRVRVRVHDTLDAFARASGRPAFMLGAVTGDQIELAPLWVLRERGMLERTIRRELVQLMVGGILPARPAWLRDGAAAYFADPAATNNARPPCPQDAELQQPVSVGAFGDALARARACFERQISGGRDWRRAR
jgi:SpoIID/LytB domain protein